MGAERQAFGAKQSAIANTPESFGFTAEASFGSKIIAVGVANDTSIKRTYKAYIVASGGTATIAQVPTTSVNLNTTDQAPELIGQVIPPGGTVQFESSFALSLNFTVSVRDLD